MIDSAAYLVGCELLIERASAQAVVHDVGVASSQVLREQVAVKGGKEGIYGLGSVERAGREQPAALEHPGELRQAMTAAGQHSAAEARLSAFGGA